MPTNYMKHIFICSIGFIAIVHRLFLFVGNSIFTTQLNLNEFAIPFYFPHKRIEIFSYIACAFFLFMYYVLSYCYLYIGRKRTYHGVNNVLFENLYTPKVVSLVLFLNILLFVGKERALFDILLRIIIWGVIVSFPLWYNSIKTVITLVKSQNRKHEFSITCRICKGILIVIILQASAMFYPFVFNEPMMINEYLDIPEQTLVNGVIVQNNDYYQEHKLLGLTSKYDPDRDKGATPYSSCGANLPNSPKLTSFLFSPINQTKYYYDNHHQMLYAAEVLTENDRLFLESLAVNEKERQEVNKLVDYTQQFKENEEARKLSQEEKTYITANEFEVHWQIYNRWIFHHHNFVLGPINEYALGKDIHNLFMQYGWFNVVFLKKIMELVGGISYQNYFKVLFSFYYFYYALFIWVLFLLFKKLNYVVIAAALSFGVINLIGFDFLFLAPGLNPVRHFFDVIIVICLFYLLQHQKRKYLYLAMLSAIIGVINNTQMGLFLLVAFVATLLTRYINEKETRNYLDICCTIITGLVGVYLFFGVKIGTDQMSQYYLGGFLGFPLDKSIILSALVLFTIGYAIILRLIKAQDSLKYIALFLLFYSQEMYVYYVWGATDTQFLNFGPIYILTIITMLQLLSNNIEIVKINEHKIMTVLFIISFIIYGMGLKQYYTTKVEYDNIFKTHTTYKWNFETAKFTSTMNPRYFIDSVNLIQKYSFDNNIYIISKYDNILPFLSKRYSAMPFFDVPWFLLSQKEIKQCIDVIDRDQPQYLFIDTDINRSYQIDVISQYSKTFGWLNQESNMRIQRLNLLKIIYNHLEQNYEPVEQGFLITVYKRK